MQIAGCCIRVAADVVVVTATRDGMNLTPYEYVVCRQGPASSSGSPSGGGSR